MDARAACTAQHATQTRRPLAADTAGGRTMCVSHNKAATPCLRPIFLHTSTASTHPPPLRTHNIPLQQPPPSKLSGVQDPARPDGGRGRAKQQPSPLRPPHPPSPPSAPSRTPTSPIAVMMLSQRSCTISSTPSFRSSQRPARRSHCVLVRASGAESNGKAIEEGASVKVVAAIKVFHAPGAPADGIDLQGKTGTMVKNTTFYKGKELSPNLPFKVQFAIDKPDGTQGKFFAHLEADELEVV